MAPKRKRPEDEATPAEIQLKRPANKREASSALDPQTNSQVFDAPDATRASPDSDASINEDILPTKHHVKTEHDDDSPLSDVPQAKPAAKKKAASKKAKPAPIDVKTTDNKRDFAIATMAATKAAAAPKKEPAPAKISRDDGGERSDPDEPFDEEADPEELLQALSRPPPVNSSILPLPWKGRLGYACLNTYLRNSNPPVFQSRTTRIAQILEHRHPLKDPSQPHHAIKNRPDLTQPADVRLGQQHIEQLALANCKDMIKMLKWNDKYNIKFFRLSSEAFPFASHAEYGYKLAPFATEALAEVGRTIAELGHRVSTHPGQFTQLGSPRKSVIDAAFADLEFHNEFLSLLKLPPQIDRDAVMVLHMGGTFGDKPATLDRFRENYSKLSDGIKARLVLENDDMCWGVHDILPICKELSIPIVLDFHHHNIIFDKDQIREGSHDIIALYPEIKALWDVKQIRQKMHYSEPTPPAVTPTQRRKHNPRVWSLPPCPNDMDLMIEAKDKEQAVFELMKTFKLPGFEKFSDIIPHTREDDNKPIRPVRAKKPAAKKKGKKVKEEDDEDAEMEDAVVLEEAGPRQIPEEEIGMGGPDGRVYWPPGMEEWLRPVKRVVKKKEPGDKPAKKGKAAAKKEEATEEEEGSVKDEAGSTAAEDSIASAPPPAAKPAARKAKRAAANLPVDGEDNTSTAPADASASTGAAKAKAAPKKRAPAKKKIKTEATPEEDEAAEEDDDSPVTEMSDSEIEERIKQADKELKTGAIRPAASRKASGRAAKAQVNYKEEDVGGMSE
jgi:UV DNA damage endonuclease